MRSREIPPIKAETGRRIAFAASLVAAGNVLSRLLGFVREPVIAALFGATGTADAFEVATRVPNMLFDVVVGGAVSAVLVPVFSGFADDKERSAKLFYTLLLIVGVAIAAVAGVLVALAHPFVTLLAPAFSNETHDMAVTMLRITLPAVILLGLSAVASGRLYAAERFAFPAFSVSALNGTLIVGALALTPLVGPPGVALGYLAGAAAHLAIQVPGLIAEKIPRSRPNPFGNADLRTAMLLYAPVLAGLIFAQFITSIDTRLASGTGEGSLAMMRFATRLQQFPLGIVVAAVSLAALPALSRAAPARFADLPKARDFKQVLSGTIRYMLLLIIPATVLVIGMSEPLVRFVYQRGEFVPAATGPTSIALVIYALQLPLVALDQIFIFAYYSARNTITPVLMGVAGGIVYLAVAVPLVGSAGFHGLVWANTIQNSFHGLVLGLLLWRALRARPDAAVLRFVARMLPATLVLAAGVFAGTQVAGLVEPEAKASLVTIAIAGSIGLAAYAAGLWLFRVREARTAAQTVAAIAQRFLRPTSKA